MHYWIYLKLVKASCVRAVAQPAARDHTNFMRALASSAVAVSVMRYVGGVCNACCRALLDKPQPGASFVRLCGRVVAFHPAVRSHTKGLCGACNIGGEDSNCVLRRRFLRRFSRYANARRCGCVRAFHVALRSQTTTATNKLKRHNTSRQRDPNAYHTW